MREQLLGRVDESAVLDELPGLEINYDPARAPEAGSKVVEGHWHVDSAATLIGREGPGPPEHGGAWEVACQLVSKYEFADARILHGVYRQDSGLAGRDMLLEARFFGLRFYVGVRITGVIDEERATGDGPAQVWGWCYQTLQGHLEQGQLSYEVIKNLSTGRVTFRVAGYSRPAPIQNPVIRLGFWLFGRWAQERFYRNIQSRMADLVRAAQHGRPLPLTRPRRYGPTASCWHPPGPGRIHWSAWPVDGSTPRADQPAPLGTTPASLTSASGAARSGLAIPDQTGPEQCRNTPRTASSRSLTGRRPPCTPDTFIGRSPVS